MKVPIGAISVDRRKTGDEAWIMGSDGQWEPTEPPARKPDTKDGSAEYWEPIADSEDAP